MDRTSLSFVLAILLLSVCFFVCKFIISSCFLFVNTFFKIFVFFAFYDKLFHNFMIIPHRLRHKQTKTPSRSFTLCCFPPAIYWGKLPNSSTSWFPCRRNCQKYDAGESGRPDGRQLSSSFQLRAWQFHAGYQQAKQVMPDSWYKLWTAILLKI